jgi:hypothetical protein
MKPGFPRRPKIEQNLIDYVWCKFSIDALVVEIPAIAAGMLARVQDFETIIVSLAATWRSPCAQNEP